MNIKKLIIPGIIVLFIAGCQEVSQKNKDQQTSPEPEQNDTIKIKKSYYSDGSIKSEVPIVEGKRHGIAKNFYSDGTVSHKVVYENGLRHGASKWYYETGELYRETPYVKGKMEGIRKKYYRNGNLKAEIPFRNGYPVRGLKEYNVNGNPVNKNYPEIIFNPIDKLAFENEYILEFRLSDNRKNVKYFLVKETDADRKLRIELTSKDGKGKREFYVPPGQFVMEKITILAMTKTKMGNVYVTEKTHNLAIEN